ncbi:hypothetical protein TYRP_017777, partial [Tyrophagus putrescentiae]
MSGQAAHPDVTWPLSTPSSSGLARCDRETLVVGCLRPRRSGLCCPRTSSDFPPTQSSGSSERCENGSESAHCCDSVPRLRTAAKASATSAKTKDNVPNFLGFLVNHK